jgi:hypothetical protein
MCPMLDVVVRAWQGHQLWMIMSLLKAILLGITNANGNIMDIPSCKSVFCPSQWFGHGYGLSGLEEHMWYTNVLNVCVISDEKLGNDNFAWNPWIHTRWCSCQSWNERLEKDDSSHSDVDGEDQHGHDCETMVLILLNTEVQIVQQN